MKAKHRETIEKHLKHKKNREWDLRAVPTDNKEKVQQKGKNLVVLTNEETKEKEVIR